MRELPQPTYLQQFDYSMIEDAVRPFGAEQRDYASSRYAASPWDAGSRAEYANCEHNDVHRDALAATDCAARGTSGWLIESIQLKLR